MALMEAKNYEASNPLLFKKLYSNYEKVACFKCHKSNKETS